MEPPVSKPTSYWIVMATCLVLALACLYLAYLTESPQGNKGFWLFIAFGVLFLLPPTAMLAQGLRAQPEAVSHRPVEFAHHWHVISAAVIFLLIVLASVLAAITS